MVSEITSGAVQKLLGVNTQLSAESRGTTEPVHRNCDAMDSILLRGLIVRLRIWLVKRKLNLAGWLETRQPR